MWIFIWTTNYLLNFSVKRLILQQPALAGVKGKVQIAACPYGEMMKSEKCPIAVYPDLPGEAGNSEHQHYRIDS